MSVRTETTTIEAVFCDFDCDRQAEGPCAVCEKDVCYYHQLEGVHIAVHGNRALICPDCRAMPISALPKDQEIIDRWRQFYAKREAIDRLTDQ